MTVEPQIRQSESASAPYSYCTRCGCMFIKTPPLPAISCRCGAMQSLGTAEMGEAA